MPATPDPQRDRPAPTRAPTDAPLSALPSPFARALAFIAVLIGGLAGGMIGYAFLDLQGASSTWSAVAALVGALVFAGGTAVIAVLVLRAMGEWKQLQDR